MVRLPIEYQEVEYLESTGTQVIKTDIACRYSMTAESVIAFTAASQDTYSAGCLDVNFRLGFNGFYNRRIQIGYNRQYKNPGINVADLKPNTVFKYKTVFKPSDQRIYINDELIASYNIENTYPTLTGVNVGIFGRWLGNSADLKCKCKMYRITFSDDDEILGNFIPCYRKSDNEPGMYDTISGTFYTNAGTGEFLVGGDVTWDTASLLERRRMMIIYNSHEQPIPPEN